MEQCRQRNDGTYSSLIDDNGASLKFIFEVVPQCIFAVKWCVGHAQDPPA